MSGTSPTNNQRNIVTVYPLRKALSSPTLIRFPDTDVPFPKELQEKAAAFRTKRNESPTHWTLEFGRREKMTWAVGRLVQVSNCQPIAPIEPRIDISD